jgi:hypothetical protein
MDTGIHKRKTGLLGSLPQYFFGIILGGESPGTRNEVPERPAKQILTVIPRPSSYSVTFQCSESGVPRRQLSSMQKPKIRYRPYS